MKLGELVGLSHLRCQIVAVESEFDREIRWVCVTELEDPSFYLLGGEAVMTNGLWQDRTTSDQFVSRLVASRVCGLGYGLGPVSLITPPALIAACEEHRLPLFEVHNPVSFSRIIEAFAARQAEERQGALLHAIRRSKAFVEAIAAGSGADAVLSVLARDYGVFPSLHDSTGHLLAATTRRPSPDDIRSVAAAIREQRPLPALINLESGEEGLLFSVEPSGTDAYLLCRKQEFSAEDRGAIAETLQFLKLEFAHRQAVQALEMRFASELIDLILSGDSHPAESGARLRAFGLEPNGSLAVLVIRRPVAWHDEIAQQVPIRFFRGRGLPTVAARRGSDTVVVATWPGSEADLKAAAAELASSLGDESAPVSVGIGAISRGTEQLRTSLLEAQHGAAIGIDSGQPVSVISHADYPSHNLLVKLQDRELQLEFRRSLLGPLIDYDTARRGDLVRTLRCFLTNTGQWQATADQLHIHVNTLRHRLRRVEDLTGRSLTRMDDRVDFYLALKVEPPAGWSAATSDASPADVLPVTAK